MAAYTQQVLLEETGKLLEGKPGAAAHLAEVWEATDRYVASCLEQKRGVILPNFCVLGWQVTRLRDKSVHRPHFRLLDTFVRAHGIDTTKEVAPAREQELMPTEEFNFSKAAIKFSSQLTKDHVFTGLRLLIQKAGEVIGQNRPTILEFSFGKLIAKERTVRFAFAPELYIAHGIDVPDGSDAKPFVTNPTFCMPDSETRDGLSLKGNGVRSNRVGCPLTCPDVETPEDTERGASSLGRTEAPARTQACADAYRDAVHRQISTLEERASRALHERRELDSYVQRCMDADAAMYAHRQGKLREHRAHLQLQIDEKRVAPRERERDGCSDCASVSEGSLQPGVHERFLGGPQESSREAMAPREPRHRPAGKRCRGRPHAEGLVTLQVPEGNLRVALEEQIQGNRARREAMKGQERQFDERLLEVESQQASASHDLQMERRAREKEVLSRAWQEGRRLKEIQKSIEAIELGKRPPCDAPCIAAPAVGILPHTCSPPASPRLGRQDGGRGARSVGSGASSGTSGFSSACTPRTTGRLPARSTALGTAAAMSLHRYGLVA